MLVVMKFGGSSLANKEKIFRAANRCAREVQKGRRVIMVLSAMGEMTDELIEHARKINGTPTLREMDMLLTIGEQISVAFMAQALQTIGVPAISLNAFQVKIKTSKQHGNAKILHIDRRRIMQELLHGKVVIVTGFQGVNRYNDYTTLGRGGSDTTAVALAATFHAAKCDIYTDVDGVYSEDPRKNLQAEKIKELNYDEMYKIAKSGAQVLEKRAVKIAKKYKVPVEVKSSVTGRRGTLIREKRK